jgi:glycosyltransferase involved in cell wall biosynthesis
MKLSVIVPSYKFAKFLEVNLLTVLNQKTNFDFEVIVRDDFSEDGSDKILKRLKNIFPNLIVHEAKENWGFHKNIKFLLEEAKGKYIAYIDGDDYYTDPLKLQKQVDFLEENPDYVML